LGGTRGAGDGGAGLVKSGAGIEGLAGKAKAGFGAGFVCAAGHVVVSFCVV
jgi:hypothetical protein